MAVKIDPSWYAVLRTQFEAPYFAELKQFLVAERQQHTCYPPGSLIFNAFDSTPFDQVKVVILGQDPYHEPGQAEGLAFSVPDTVKTPPSLRNIKKELELEFGKTLNGNSLIPWARQGVLLLNASLTVREGEAASHSSIGWQNITFPLLQKLSQQGQIVFFLWGNHARKLAPELEAKNNLILEAAHPSPLSARKFLGCGHFKLANEFLISVGKPPIIWC